MSPVGRARGRGSSKPRPAFGSCRQPASPPRKPRWLGTRPGSAVWTCTWGKGALTVPSWRWPLTDGGGL
eukprot:3493244-Lingulodinium_polyedra.AAC.1